MNMICDSLRKYGAHLLFYEQQRPNDVAIQKSMNCKV